MLLVCVFYLGTLVLSRSVVGVPQRDSRHELMLVQEQPTTEIQDGFGIKTADVSSSSDASVSPQLPDNVSCFGRSWGRDEALEALLAALRESSVAWGKESELGNDPLTRFGLCSASDGSPVAAILSELANEAKRKETTRLDVLHPTKELLADREEEARLVFTLDLLPSPLLRLKPTLVLVLERTPTDLSALGVTFSSESLDPPTQTACLSEGTHYIILTGKPSEGAGPQRWRLTVEAQSPDAGQKLREILTGGGSENDFSITPLLLFSSDIGTDIRFSHLPASGPASSDTFSFLCELQRFLADALPQRPRMSDPPVSAVKLDTLHSLPSLRLGLSSSETLLVGLLNSSAPMLFSFTLGSDLQAVPRVELAMSAALLQVLRQRLGDATDQITQVMKEKEVGPVVMQKLHRLKALSGFPAEGPATGESQYRAFLLLKAVQTAVGLCEVERGLRAARSGQDDPGRSGPCRLHSLTVSLEKFVLSPDTYDIKNCYGVCAVPLPNTKNHAVILNSQIEAGRNVGRSLCCVPVEYEALQVVDLDPQETSVSELLIQEHMVATRCGCR